MTDPRPFGPLRAGLLGASLLAVLLVLPGCGLLYSHNLEYEDFSLHGNHDVLQLRRTGDTIQQVFDAYRRLFPHLEEKVNECRICYEEDPLSRERIFTGDLRQEGYYLPVLDLIQLSPRRPQGETDDLSVIFHEMAHHFLISAHPETASVYWLNEGLACCLEVSFFEGTGELRSPLFHPTLFLQAQRLLRRQGSTRFREELEELLDANWFRFHRTDGRNDSYAYSWSLYWHLLRSSEGTLEERIHAILEMKPERIREEIPGLLRELARPAEVHLHSIAGDRGLRTWALEQFSELPAVRGEWFIDELEEELSIERSPKTALNPRSWSVATRLMNGRVRGLDRSTRNGWHGRLAGALSREDLPFEIRCAVAEALARDGSRSWAYIEPLIELLEHDLPELRIAAARALARFSRQKPTVTNPIFWRESPAAVRSVEVREWREWYARLRR